MGSSSSSPQNDNDSSKTQNDKANVDMLSLKYMLLDAQTVSNIRVLTHGRLSNQEIKLLYHIYLEAYFSRQKIRLSDPNAEEFLQEESTLEEILRYVGDEFVQKVVRGMIDQKNDGVDFSLFAKTIALLSRGTRDECRKFVFRLYDTERKGEITKDTMKKIIEGLNWDIKEHVAKECVEQKRHEDNMPYSPLILRKKKKNKKKKRRDTETENTTRWFLENSRTMKSVSSFSRSTSKESLDSGKKDSANEEQRRERVAVKSIRDWLLAEKRAQVEMNQQRKQKKERKLQQKRNRIDEILLKEVDEFFEDKTVLTFEEYEQQSFTHLWSQIYKAFGILDYFNDNLFKPIEAQIHRDILIPPTKEGFLIQRKPGLWASSGMVALYSKKWCVMRSGFMYLFDNQHSTKPSRVISLTNSVVRLHDEFNDSEHNHYCFHISAENGQYRRYFSVEGEDERTQWLYAITANTPELPDNQYHSFAPERESIGAKWFVDAKDYYNFLLNTLNNAVHEIFIAGWWVSPELFLNRDVPDPKSSYRGLECRLDILLKRKAEKGINVYILVWNETKIASTQNSFHTKKQLEKMHSNIKVLCHPASAPLYWSHHQKVVVVDQDIAFVGGLDLCFGRYDDKNHEMVDACHLRTKWPGKDYFNEGLKAFVGVDQPFSDAIDRTQVPRLPWHDIHVCVDGVAARDIGCSFIQRWNHHVLDLNVSFEYPHIFPKTGPPSLVLTSDQVQRTECDVDGSSGSKKTSLMSDSSDSTSNDLSSSSNMSPPNSGNHTLKHKRQGSNSSNIVSVPIGISQFKPPSANNLPPTPKPYLTSSSESNDNNSNKTEHSFSSNCRVQVVRSITQWSGSIYTETSIHQAYIDLISKSEHFIYIENQYFISSLCGGGCQNKIAETILNRIRKAILAKDVFRVIVVMPCLPTGGSWKDSASIQYVMKWQYWTISRGGNSLLEQLYREFPHINPEDYITFYSLRGCDYLMGLPVSEQIYVHSKLMIVDDKVAIVGSANINDRSMTGERDSEICVIIEDSHRVSSTMNGQPYKANKFAYELRKNLFREHLGLEEDDNSVQDPIIESFYKDKWLKTANKNTQVYDEFFIDVPQNRIQTLEDYYHKEHFSKTFIDSFSVGTSTRLPSPILAMISGHLVRFPLDFLKKETLSPGGVEGMLPNEVFQ